MSCSIVELRCFRAKTQNAKAKTQLEVSKCQLVMCHYICDWGIWQGDKQPPASSPHPLLLVITLAVMALLELSDRWSIGAPLLPQLSMWTNLTGCGFHQLASAVWNSLSATVLGSPSLTVLKSTLKTHLFDCNHTIWPVLPPPLKLGLYGRNVYYCYYDYCCCCCCRCRCDHHRHHHYHNWHQLIKVMCGAAAAGSVVLCAVWLRSL